MAYEQVLTEVNLYNSNGEFVSKAKVLPYTTFKDCIIHWGSRFFVYNCHQDKFLEGHYMIADLHKLVDKKSN